MLPPEGQAPEIIHDIVDSLEAGEEAILATVVGPRDLPARFLGRKMLSVPGVRIEGTLGSPSLDVFIHQLWARPEDRGQLPRTFTVEVWPGEYLELGLPPGTRLELFIDLLVPASSLLIVGGGHIAKPLCTIAKTLGFSVTVMDDRISFANRDRFPEADRIITGYFSEELAKFPINSSTYVVVVTRGHSYDQAALQAVVGSRAAYVGMIGSTPKVRTVLGNLAEAGVPREQLERVYSPIGLDIGAETPAEIATGIMAEIINVRRRRQRHPSSMSQPKRVKQPATGEAEL